MIHIMDDWYVDTDKYNWILFKKSVIKNENSKNYGKETNLDETYHGSLEQAIRYLCRKKQRELGKKKTTELEQFAARIEKTNNQLWKKIKEIKCQ